MHALLALTPGGLLTDVGRSLREGLYMFWETLWALVLGFGLSGAVQAFVSRRELQATLGDHRPAAVLRASGFGMVSSSCSYAASALAKSLFQKGADFVAAMIFMFASTNLVVELGIILVVLIGWQFAVGEFVGGAIMIGLLALVGPIAFSPRLVEAARRRVQREAATVTGAHDHHGPAEHHHEPSGYEEVAAEPTDPALTTEDLDTEPWSVRLRSRAGWTDAASYTMADLTMLRREMVIGYVVAGFLATLVPDHVWHAIFWQGHGFWTTLENVIVGPFIALISFVCSIGNVPLAAALWVGGISFGGVISFIFADLIALPILLIYRKLYGGRLALRMLATFWIIMSLAGLATELLFRALGIIPTTRHSTITDEHFSWNYTTWLNIVFLLVFGVLYWLYRHRDQFGSEGRYAIDPVCGMQVEVAHAPATLRHDGDDLYFCSDHCLGQFRAEPGPRVRLEQ